MLSVIAYIHVKPEKTDEAINAAKELVEKVKDEEGTLFYSFSVSEKDPSTIVFMERYKDMDAISAHSSTPHFKEFMKKAAAFSSMPPEVNIYKEISSI
ncbi:MAG: antibiotic biosynthesis monooxygenase [Desulfobacteraceae bacterium]|nr:antibiotic biosynthesis monooxygenase [Desulfobacteraceae bacterium]MCB9495075.1 antibiotic biosynthesis monooxygenase [Desulfobacteraceae bacterium]